MKLNLDCVRDVLLCVEENTGVRTRCMFVDTARSEAMHSAGIPTSEPQNYQINLLAKYNIDEIMYHLGYCHDADLIALCEGSSPYIMYVADLTPKGHDFLANIRDSKIWNGVKDVASKVGSKSLGAVTQIASNVITELIKAQFGL